MSDHSHSAVFTDTDVCAPIVFHGHAQRGDHILHFANPPGIDRINATVALHRWAAVGHVISSVKHPFKLQLVGLLVEVGRRTVLSVRNHRRRGFNHRSRLHASWVDEPIMHNSPLVIVHSVLDNAKLLIFVHESPFLHSR